MRFLKKLFKVGFIRPTIGDRVFHKESRKFGTVVGTAVIVGSVKVHALTVQFDNETFANDIAENEFIKVGR